MTPLRLLLVLPIALAGCTVVPAQPATTPQPQPQPEGEVTERDHRDPPPGDPGGGLEAAAPFECHGNESVILDDCLIEADDVAVDAHGNCSVVLTNCTIRAGRLAIDAHGNASVVIRGGSVEGATAVDAHGNSSVVIESAAVSGAVDRHGNASVVVN